MNGFLFQCWVTRAAEAVKGLIGHTESLPLTELAGSIVQMMSSVVNFHGKAVFTVQQVVDHFSVVGAF